MFVPDGESRLIETPGGRIAVTTLPWPVHGGDLMVSGCRTNFIDFTTKLLRRGKILQTEESVPWIVLCHEPPGNTPLAATYAARKADLARMMIEAAFRAMVTFTRGFGSANSGKSSVSIPANLPPESRRISFFWNGGLAAITPRSGTGQDGCAAPRRSLAA
jgi:hypothetical protein